MQCTAVSKNLPLRGRCPVGAEGENLAVARNISGSRTVLSPTACGRSPAAGPDGEPRAIGAGAVVLACGGIGGLYKNSTNFPHITGDAIAMALRHGVACEHLDYIQIHPTT